MMKMMKFVITPRVQYLIIGNSLLLFVCFYLVSYSVSKDINYQMNRFDYIYNCLYIIKINSVVLGIYLTVRFTRLKETLHLLLDDNNKSVIFARFLCINILIIIGVNIINVLLLIIVGQSIFVLMNIDLYLSILFHIVVFSLVYYLYLFTTYILYRSMYLCMTIFIAYICSTIFTPFMVFPHELSLIFVSSQLVFPDLLIDPNMNIYFANNLLTTGLLCLLILSIVFHIFKRSAII